jgi:hypothetical protein
MVSGVRLVAMVVGSCRGILDLSEWRMYQDLHVERGRETSGLASRILQACLTWKNGRKAIVRGETQDGMECVNWDERPFTLQLTFCFAFGSSGV